MTFRDIALPFLMIYRLRFKPLCSQSKVCWAFLAYRSPLICKSEINLSIHFVVAVTAIKSCDQYNEFVLVVDSFLNLKELRLFKLFKALNSLQYFQTKIFLRRCCLNLSVSSRQVKTLLTEAHRRDA